MSFLDISDIKESTCNVGDQGSVPGLGRSPEREWKPTLVFLPGKYHGQRRLAGKIHGVTKHWTRLSA